MRNPNAALEPAGGSPGRATLWAAVVAAVILVTTVLPAEYGIDWTGLGRLTGLTAMGEGKVAAARAEQTPTTPSIPADSKSAPAAPDAAIKERYATASKGSLRTDAIEIPLAPNAQVEYKTVLAEGETIVFDWDAGSAIRFDFHGEPATGPKGMFLSFEKGSAARSAGSLRAPFGGTHGWYWKNTGPRAVVIKLRVTGFHTALERQ